MNLNIVFICGCLEPGKDGVGDYTRILALELNKSNHFCTIVAINDSYISSSEAEEPTMINGGMTKVLRYSNEISSEDLILKLKSQIFLGKVDIVSLQYVPYSFDKKGIPIYLAGTLKRIFENREFKLEIMFHELWVGMEKGASFKHRITGSLQKSVIKNMLSRLNPAIIHTQNILYVKQLKHIGYESFYLPLFSNIAIENELSAPSESSSDMKYFVVFGSIHPEAQIENFSNQLKAYNKENSEQIGLKLVGRNGSELDSWITILKKNKIKFEIIGEQNANIINDVLKNAKYGITTTPVALIDKSGTVAAMRFHNLPILSISKTWNSRLNFNIPLPEDVAEFKTDNLKLCLSKLDKSKSISNSVSYVAKSFLESFN